MDGDGSISKVRNVEDVYLSIRHEEEGVCQSIRDGERRI